jgi:hypothetical protein
VSTAAKALTWGLIDMGAKVLFSVGQNLLWLGSPNDCGRLARGEKQYDHQLKCTYPFGANSFGDHALFDEFSNFE